MNEAPEMIEIDLIVPNPFQVRQAEDPAVVAELAENIQRNTLLQPPTVREYQDLGIAMIGGVVPKAIQEEGLGYQLAFGHTRLAAYRLLAKKDRKYNLMPCFIRPLDDLQMFEIAVAENIKRRDLNPIERARAMQTYMDRFRKTSAETGEFFACDESTVRGTIRLLGLPETAQVQLAAGEINVGAARSLLTLQRIAPGKVEDATKAIQQGTAPAEALVSKLANSPNVEYLQRSYEHRDPPTAGDHLWKLDFDEFPSMPKLTQKAAQEAGAVGTDGGKRKKELKGWIDNLESGLVAAQALIDQGAPAETIEKLAHLVHPPACTRCQYYVRGGGDHLCCWNACRERKMLAWATIKAVELSKKLNIPIYDPATDGEERLEYLETYSYPTADKAWEDRIPGLRLMPCRPKGWGRYEYTQSPLVILVDITPENIQAAKDKEKRRQEEREQTQARFDEAQAKRELMEKNRQISRQFINDVAVSAFYHLYDPLPDQFVIVILKIVSDPDDIECERNKDGEPVDPKEFFRLVRMELADWILSEVIDWELRSKGPLAVAEHLQGLAKDWEVTLPSDWLEKAKTFAQAADAAPVVESEEDDEVV